ncbi:hypothetical protein A2Y99_01945 [Candidatus Gottesmanbacteria bacterium RBG_13_37_7]|uniref:Rod shape-determining protein MreD n=1 Tax=Candidatus Gottesmanbacteria bacterium RBG_13_37_7 TaxID=1798369 RepID=A0A1F5YHZ8_9BACT|nr:MAG: hypothetical protein A2Y99_01945 [Candidatus Gottesmanbacteria bacterium RBG_13_37_7]
MKKENYSYIKQLFVLILILVGVLSRTVYHPGYNIEIITSICLLSGYYLGWRWGMVVPLVIMVVTDLFIGNTNIIIFTWSAYILIGILGYVTKLKTPASPAGRQNSKLKAIRLIGLGFASSIWFYLWTNFGVWILDSFGMYPKTLSGLINCYILGLPFFKYNIIGNIIFVPLTFTIVETIMIYLPGLAIRQKFKKTNIKPVNK